MRSLAARIAVAFDVIPAGRYARYLAGTEWTKLDGRWALLPTYASALKLAASGQAFEALLSNVADAALGGPDGWVPLAAIGTEEPQFLVVRATGEDGSVAMWEHENGRFVPVAPTLDAFIASASATKGKAKAAEAVVAKTGMGLPALWKLIQKALDVTDKVGAKGRGNGKTRVELEALLSKLDSEMATLPNRASVADTPYALVPGHAHYARGKLLRALGRFEEACAVLDGAIIDGVRSPVAPDMVCQIWLADLDRPAKVIELVRASADPSPAMQRMAAMAMVRLGDAEGAVATLDRVVARRIESILKLTPKLGREGAAAEQRKFLAKYAGEYGAKHGLEAEIAAVLARVTFT